LIRLKGKSVPGAEDRQARIPGFDQRVYSQSHVLCIGAGGLIGNIAPTLCRKGIGALTVLDDDVVEPSNLNRQRFYSRDIGRNKAVALVRNLQRECIVPTRLAGYALRLEEAIEKEVDLGCDVAVCGVDNNPARIAASRHFRSLGIPVIFAAVSADADHGYVFVQAREGACFGCLFPDAANDDRFPCPGTPAIADVLQLVGALAVYAVDSCLTVRKRAWNYRSIGLPIFELDSCRWVAPLAACRVCSRRLGHSACIKDYSTASS